MSDTAVTDVKPDAPTTTVQDAVQETSPEQPVEAGTQEEHRGPTGWIPKMRLDEVIAEREAARHEAAQARETAIRHEERLKAIEDQKRVSTEAPTYSRVQLRGFVEAGQITQDAADDMWAEQIRKQVVSDVRREVDTRTTESMRLQSVLTRIHEYTSVMPQVNQRGTPEWTKASQEYSELCDLHGMPKTELQKQSMMLTAMKAAHGSVADVKRRVDATRQSNASERETMSDTTSPQRRSTASDDKRDPVKSLSPEQREHYEKMFKKSNDYPNGWDDVRKELAWAPPKWSGRR